MCNCCQMNPIHCPRRLLQHLPWRAADCRSCKKHRSCCHYEVISLWQVIEVSHIQCQGKL